MNAQEVMDGTPSLIVKHEQDYCEKASSSEPWIRIKFQCGPVREVGQNGVQIEDVIAVLLERLEGFQRGRFACFQNTLAISGLHTALTALRERTARRETQGVEGTNQPHED